VPKLEKRLTDTVAKKLPVPPAPPEKNGKKVTGYQLYWCKVTPGFGVRVTSDGARAWIMERRVDGKTVRRTLGAASGRGAISADDARDLQIERSGELQKGTDQLEVKRAKAKEAKRDVTLESATKTYVAEKVIGDGRPLKPRTKADYLGMIDPPGVSAVKLKKDGTPNKKTGVALKGGELYPLARLHLSKITADRMRAVHKEVKAKRGKRRATYAMQVLRAMLNWHGVVIPDNPFGEHVAGKDKIVLPASKGKPNPIRPNQLGAWWRAACAAGRGGPGRRLSADLLQFIVLTGVRKGESAGNEYETGILVRHVDLEAGRIFLPDTKNRGDHYLYLSRQALEIVQRNMQGKKLNDNLFGVKSAPGTLMAICTAANVERRSPHALRKTFSSVAQGLVSVYTLKAMINHASGGDVTAEFYIEVDEEQLRHGWQMVADYIERLASSKQASFTLVDGQVVARKTANG
jgi:integrase